MIAAGMADLQCASEETAEGCAARGCVYNNASITSPCVANGSFTLTGSCRPGDSEQRCVLPLVLWANCANATTQAACAAIPYCVLAAGNCTVDTANPAAGLTAVVGVAKERGAVVVAAVYQANGECGKGAASAAACKAISFNYTIGIPPAARSPPAAKSPADAASPSPSPAPASRAGNAAGALPSCRRAASLALALLAILLA
jgi:hypothetical protein